MRKLLLALGAFALLLSILWFVRAEPQTRRTAAPGLAEGATSAAAKQAVAESAAGRVASRGASRSGSVRKTANRRSEPLPALGTPLADFVDELHRRARSGDAAAACRLAAELMDCSELRTSTARFKQQQEMMGKRKPLSDPVREKKALDAIVDSLASWSQGLEASEKRCARIDPKRWHDIYEYQRIAAGSGHLPSMRFFVNRPALEFDVFAQIEQYRRYPSDVRPVLERAIRAGDFQTLGGLVGAHRARISTGRFESRVHQALFQTPEELEVYFEVAKTADFNVVSVPMTKQPPATPPEPLPATLCPSDPRCLAIKTRARSILADYSRNLEKVKQADSLRLTQQNVVPGHTCVQIVNAP